MKVIYVAGPYRSQSGWDGVFQNIVRARSFARSLWLKGWAVICPHANSFFMDGVDIESRTFLDGDLELVRRCDALFMIPGWERSEGSRGEYNLALELGRPTYFSLDEVPHEAE